MESQLLAGTTKPKHIPTRKRRPINPTMPVGAMATGGRRRVSRPARRRHRATTRRDLEKECFNEIRRKAALLL